MLLVKTEIKSSAIHGIGIFTLEFIPKNTKIAEFNPLIDRTLTKSQFDLLTQIEKDFILHYGYIENSIYHLNLDNMRFMNHSVTPNTRQGILEDFAEKDIQIGEELTCNYSFFDERYQ